VLLFCAVVVISRFSGCVYSLPPFMPIIAKGLHSSNHYHNRTLTLGNTRKPSIAGKPRDDATNSIVATTAFSYGGPSPFAIVSALKLKFWVADAGEPSARHQLTLRDHGYGASVSPSVSVKQRRRARWPIWNYTLASAFCTRWRRVICLLEVP